MDTEDHYIQRIIAQQRQMLEERNQDLAALKQKLAQYETAILEKDFYVSRLEMDLEHAIDQCQRIAADKGQNFSWINRAEPGVELKSYTTNNTHQKQ